MSIDETNKSAIAARLVLARKQAGLTQGQVAEMMGLSRPSISEAEAGRRNVSATELASLAKIYGVSIAWLGNVDQTENPEKDRIHLAARGLAKLGDDDLKKILDLINALRNDEEK